MTDDISVVPKGSILLLAETPFDLPVYVRVSVMPSDNDEAECFIIATENKKGWGHGGDGLTVTGAVDRTDFDFRFQVFGKFLRKVERHSSVKLAKNSWNEIALALGETRSCYWANGAKVASCEYVEDELPTEKPFIGVYAFKQEVSVKHITATNDSELLSCLNDTVLTLVAEEGPSFSFLTLGGELAYSISVEASSKWPLNTLLQKCAAVLGVWTPTLRILGSSGVPLDELSWTQAKKTAAHNAQ